MSSAPRVPAHQRAFYRKYIVSAAWKRRAREAKERAGWRCQTCPDEGTPDAPLGVHHLTYAHLGNEPPEDLLVQCEQCHALGHEGEDGEDGRERRMPNG